MILYVTSRRFCCILYRRENVPVCVCVWLCAARKTEETWTTANEVCGMPEVNKYLFLLEVSPHAITSTFFCRVKVAGKLKLTINVKPAETYF